MLSLSNILKNVLRSAMAGEAAGRHVLLNSAFLEKDKYETPQAFSILEDLWFNYCEITVNLKGACYSDQLFYDKIHRSSFFESLSFAMGSMGGRHAPVDWVVFNMLMALTERSEFKFVGCDEKFIIPGFGTNTDSFIDFKPLMEQLELNMSFNWVRNLYLEAAKNKMPEEKHHVIDYLKDKCNPAFMLGYICCYLMITPSQSQVMFLLARLPRFTLLTA